MADFPTSIFSPRTIENRAGVVYDANDTKTLYAEDLEAIAEEIQAVENYIEDNPAPVKATGAEVIAGTNDEKFATPKSLADAQLATSFVDFSNDSTIVGWSSYISKVIRYKKIGKLVFVEFLISGTSNATGVSFTLPSTPSANFIGGNLICKIKDNGGAAALGYVYINPSSSAVGVYKDMPAATNWTASGTKEIRGQLFYEES